MRNKFNKSIKAVIHQPYFLPWMGYFSKLIYADKFIVLDNVFFSKRKYIDRVQMINTKGDTMWIGLPVGQHFEVACNKIHYSDKRAVNKIIKSFYASYSKARYFKQNIAQIEQALNDSFDNSDLLSDINISIIKKLLLIMELKIPQIIYCSQFPEISDATERIIMLCNETKCNALISGSEGVEKHDYEKVINNGIDVYIQDYYNNHPMYYQTRRTKLGFAKGLSVIDCIFNEGIEKTKSLITNENFKPRSYKIIQNIES